MDRLQKILAFAGDEKAPEIQHMRRLVQVIEEFAPLTGDIELRNACIQELATLEEKDQLENFLHFCSTVEEHLCKHYGKSPRKPNGSLIMNPSGWRKFQPEIVMPNQQRKRSSIPNNEKDAPMKKDFTISYYWLGFVEDDRSKRVERFNTATEAEAHREGIKHFWALPPADHDRVPRSP